MTSIFYGHTQISYDELSLWKSVMSILAFCKVQDVLHYKNQY
jgi:hypothetical protein